MRCTVCRHLQSEHGPTSPASTDEIDLGQLDTRCNVPACSCSRFTLELERRCSCGAELVSSVNDREGLCDMCLLRRRPVPDVDPDAAQAHLRKWLRERGCVCSGDVLDVGCPVHFP